MFQFTLRGIEAAYEDEVREAAQRRDAHIAEAKRVWLNLSSLEGDSGESSNGTTATAAAEQTDTRRPRRNRSKAKGSGGRTIPQETIRKFVKDAMTDQNVYYVTQTEIKDSLLADYPDAKIPSIRSAISHELSDLKDEGYLELVEKAHAGSPNKYRKTEKWARETGVLILSSEP